MSCFIIKLNLKKTHFGQYPLPKFMLAKDSHRSFFPSFCSNNSYRIDNPWPQGAKHVWRINRFPAMTSVVSLHIILDHYMPSNTIVTVVSTLSYVFLSRSSFEGGPRLLARSYWMSVHRLTVVKVLESDRFKYGPFPQLSAPFFPARSVASSWRVSCHLLLLIKPHSMW